MIRNTSAGNAPDLAWFKSSYSDGTEGDSCVEIAITQAMVHVRDSKNTGGPQLALTPVAWADFVAYASESRPFNGTAPRTCLSPGAGRGGVWR